MSSADNSTKKSRKGKFVVLYVVTSIILVIGIIDLVINYENHTGIFIPLNVDVSTFDEIKHAEQVCGKLSYGFYYDSKTDKCDIPTVQGIYQEYYLMDNNTKKCYLDRIVLDNGTSFDGIFGDLVIHNASVAKEYNLYQDWSVRAGAKPYHIGSCTI